MKLTEKKIYEFLEKNGLDIEAGYGCVTDGGVEINLVAPNGYAVFYEGEVESNQLLDNLNLFLKDNLDDIFQEEINESDKEIDILENIIDDYHFFKNKEWVACE
jgi:hypothetical protein